MSAAMMSDGVSINISTGGSAFKESPTRELSRILRDLAYRLSEGLLKPGEDPVELFDKTNRTCGSVVFFGNFSR